MKNRMIFGLSRLMPRPVAQFWNSERAGRSFVSGEKAEPFTNRLEGQPHQIAGSSDLQHEKGLRRGDDQRRQAERHQRRMDDYAAHGAEHAGKSGRPPFRQRPPDEQRHVGSRRDRDDEGRDGELDEDCGLGDEGHSARASLKRIAAPVAN